MSLGNLTLTIKINAVDKVLKRINQDKFETKYYLHEDTEEFTVNIRHSKESPTKAGVVFDRHNVELIHSVFPTESAPGIDRVTYVVIRNTRADNYTQVGYDVTAVADLLKVAGNIPDLLGWVG